MAGPWERYRTPEPQSAPSGPWERYKTNTDPASLLDYSKPIEDLRGEIERLPEGDKKRAYDMWADQRVAKERSGGFAPLPDAARGIPFIGGWLDEATAGIQSGLHSVSGGRVGAPYDEALAYERARQRQSEQENPGLAIGSQLVTGITTGGPILSRLPLGRTLAGRVGTGAGVGAGIGAAEGYAQGEGSVGNRLENAADFAKWGAGLGGALPVGSAALTRGVGWAADRLGPTVTRWRHGPEEAADEILSRNIAREGSTPAQKRLDLQQGQQTARLNSNSRATVPETLADTSDAMQRLTGSVYRAGGEAGNFVKETLQRRQRGPDNPFARAAEGPPQGQRARVMDAAERALLVRSSGTARQTERQIIDEQAREGRRLYQQAYEQSEPFDLSNALTMHAMQGMQYPDPVRKALNRAISLFTQPSVPGFERRQQQLLNRLNRIDGDSPRAQRARMTIVRQLEHLTDRQDAVRAQRFPVNNVERFDAAKKALDDMIDTAQRGGENNMARLLTGLKNDLLDAVHRFGPDGTPTANAAYLTARQAWGSAAERRDAIELGRSALRDGSEVSAEAFGDLTPGQQQLFRLGFLESLRNALARKKPGNDITQLFQEQRVTDLMREIIPRSQGARDVFANRPERFGEVMRREQRMVQTNNSVMGNSATAQRQADDMAFAGDALASMWNRFRSAPSLFNMGVEAIGVGIQRVFGYRQDVAAAMARRLLEADPRVRNQILQRLARRGGPNAFERFANELDRSANAVIGGGASASIGYER